MVKRCIRHDTNFSSGILVKIANLHMYIILNYNNCDLKKKLMVIIFWGLHVAPSVCIEHEHYFYYAILARTPRHSQSKSDMLSMTCYHLTRYDRGCRIPKINSQNNKLWDMVFYGRPYLIMSSHLMSSPRCFFSFTWSTSSVCSSEALKSCRIISRALVTECRKEILFFLR